MRFSKAVVKYRIPILILAIVLMVPSVLGILPLWIAVFGDTGVMLLAVLNSMRMRLKIK